MAESNRYRPEVDIHVLRTQPGVRGQSIRASSSCQVSRDQCQPRSEGDQGWEGGRRGEGGVTFHLLCQGPVNDQWDLSSPSRPFHMWELVASCQKMWGERGYSLDIGEIKLKESSPPQRR